MSLITGVFEGYDSLRAIELLDTVEKAECEAFLREVFAPERLALSIIEPKKD